MDNNGPRAMTFALLYSSTQQKPRMKSPFDSLYNILNVSFPLQCCKFSSNATVSSMSQHDLGGVAVVMQLGCLSS